MQKVDVRTPNGACKRGDARDSNSPASECMGRRPTLTLRRRAAGSATFTSFPEIWAAPAENEEGANEPCRFGGLMSRRCSPSHYRYLVPRHSRRFGRWNITAREDITVGSITPLLARTR